MYTDYRLWEERIAEKIAGVLDLVRNSASCLTWNTTKALVALSSFGRNKELGFAWKWGARFMF